MEKKKVKKIPELKKTETKVIVKVNKEEKVKEDLLSTEYLNRITKEMNNL